MGKTLPPSSIIAFIIVTFGFVLCIHFYLIAYKEEAHSQKTARNLIQDTCIDAAKTERNGLVEQCHMAYHLIEVAVWRAAFISLVVPEGAKAWIFLEAIVFGAFTLAFAFVIYGLRSLEEGRHFRGSLLPEKDCTLRVSGKSKYF